MPRRLGDGLLMRWARRDDADALAAFNVRIHSDDPEEPETWLGHWARDLVGDDHPAAGPDDMTVVVDESADGQIVSTLVLISQTWTYDGLPFGVGRIELVGTDPAYRKRGLVRTQLEVVHARSAARGDLVQAILGIPFFYRQFGYEMALNLGGSRLYPRERLETGETAPEDAYAVRPASADDIPLLSELYAIQTTASLVARVRDEKQWLYEMTVPNELSPYRRHFFIVETADNQQPAGYFEYFEWQKGILVREIAARPGFSLRAVCKRAVQYIVAPPESADVTERSRKPLVFALGTDHPAYDALGSKLAANRPPYAWYLRVPDLPQFLMHIAPVLEERLASSVVAGYSGALRLNLFRPYLTLDLADGKLNGVGSYEPAFYDDGDALFPGLAFLQLLFGFRGLSELRHAFPDCYPRNEEAAILLNILFPPQPSNVIGLG